MAKTINIALPADFSFDMGSGRTMTADEVKALAPEAIAFSLSYGFRQYVNDGAAVSKKETEDLSAAEIEKLKEDGRAERWSNILTASFKATRGPGLRGADAIKRDVTEEFLRSHLAKMEDRVKAKALADRTKPEGGGESNWQKACRAYAERFAEKIEAEVSRRMAVANADSAEDIF